jgi:hypothetical protein
MTVWNDWLNDTAPVMLTISIAILQFILFCVR